MAGTVCAYPKFTPVPFHEDDLWNGYPEETNAPYGVAKKAILVGAQAYREQYGLDAIFLLPGEPLRAAGQLRPGDLPRHPRTDPQDGRGAAVRTRSSSGATASPTREFLYVDDAPRGCCSPRALRRRSSPSTSARGDEISIRELAGLIAELTGFEGEIAWDTSQPNGQPRRALDTSRARELFGFEARTPLREGLERTIAWYREAAPQASSARR